MSRVVDLIITSNEINHHHGVGIYLQRLFGRGEGFLNLRSASQYGGASEFGEPRELASKYLPSAEVEARLRDVLSGFEVRRILCVPYYREEFVHAAAAKRLTGAPLCTFLMDDQNVFAPHVSDRRVDELLACSDLRLAISQEMAAVYEAKFGHRMDLMPPVVQPGPAPVPCYWPGGSDGPPRCAMIGNVWTAPRFERLRALFRATGIHVDWFGHGPLASWLDGRTGEWERDNLHCVGFLPEGALAAALAAYPFVLVPSGDGGPEDDNPTFSRLSLPSRLLFLHARTDVPVLLLGGEKTAAGHFITRHGTGLCVRAAPEDFQSAVAAITDPVRHRKLRRNIGRISRFLALENAGEWLWQSLASGNARPAPFDRVFRTLEPEYRRAVLAGVDRYARNGAGPARNAREVPALAYGRNAQFPALIGAGLLPPRPAAETELGEFMQAASCREVAAGISSGEPVLFLGDRIPDAWSRLGRADVPIWLLRDFAVWPAGAPPALAAADPASPERPPDRFAIIWSAGAADTVGQTPEAIRRFADLCDTLAAPGGRNCHVFSAVMHPDYFWTHPIYHALRRRNAPADWPDLESLIDDDDVFFMSAPTYERCWQPATGKSYADFGRLCWLGLDWTKRLE